MLMFYISRHAIPQLHSSNRKKSSHRQEESFLLSNKVTLTKRIIAFEHRAYRPRVSIPVIEEAYFFASCGTARWLFPRAIRILNCGAMRCILNATKNDALGHARFLQRDKGKALAVHSALNRLELGAKSVRCMALATTSRLSQNCGLQARC